MKRGGVVLTVLAVGMVGAGMWRALLPRIGRPTRAEIEAVLPASLKKGDAPDPAGEARYARLVRSAKGLDEAALRKGRSSIPNERRVGAAMAVLDEGPIRAPSQTVGLLGVDAFAIKNLAKACAYATADAKSRGDRAACARWAADGLRLGRAARASGGVVIDALVAIAVDSIGVRAAYLAEIGGGLDARGRERLLALLPEEDGSLPEMAAAIRRDYQGYLLPAILDPKGHARELAPTRSDPDWEGQDAEPELVGTFDPVATARLTGAIYGAIMEDLRRPRSKASGEAERLMEAAVQGLPDADAVPWGSPHAGDLWAKAKYRVRMNLGRNTLGRQVASSPTLSQIGEAGTRRAANHNLLRAVLLLRSGRRATVPDPFGTGTLRTDPRRKIVWSVGRDGKDDGGAIGRGSDASAPDLGLPYGDGAFPLATPVGGFGWQRAAPGGP